MFTNAAKQRPNEETNLHIEEALPAKNNIEIVTRLIFMYKYKLNISVELKNSWF